MGEFVVRQECSFTSDGAGVHLTSRAVGRVVTVGDAHAAPLVESGCLEEVTKPARPQPEPMSQAISTKTEADPAELAAEAPQASKRRRGRIHDDG